MSDFGVIDEIFNPAADRARQEWDEEKSHTRPAPTPRARTRTASTSIWTTAVPFQMRIIAKVIVGA
jgi:hypothetical protein